MTSAEPSAFGGLVRTARGTDLGAAFGSVFGAGIREIGKEKAALSAKPIAFPNAKGLFNFFTGVRPRPPGR